MANPYAENGFTSRQALDPGLRKAARFLPRGNALHRGYKVQRALTNLMGNAGRMRNVPVATVNKHVTVVCIVRSAVRTGHRRCCGSTAAARSWVTRPRTTSFCES